eukprot:jgi/Psemu1/34296/gm1.34296_g
MTEDHQDQNIRTEYSETNKTTKKGVRCGVTSERQEVLKKKTPEKKRYLEEILISDQQEETLTKDTNVHRVVTRKTKGVRCGGTSERQGLLTQQKTNKWKKTKRKNEKKKKTDIGFRELEEDPNESTLEAQLRKPEQLTTSTENIVENTIKQSDSVVKRSEINTGTVNGGDDNDSSTTTSSKADSSCNDTNSDNDYDSETSDNSTMGYYKVQKLSNVDEVDFEGCYRQFLPHASRNKYEEMVSNKPHLDLPPEEELTSQSDTSKAQKKALKKHSSKALNNLLYTAFYNNNARNSIIEKSKVEREGSEEKNAKLILQWPRGQVNRIFEELIKLYQRTDTGDKIQLNKDLKNIKLVSALAHTKELFEQIFGVIQKCHYKTICPTPDNLYAALQEALPAYLLIPITTTLNELHEKNAPQYVIWEKLEQMLISF